MCGIVGAVAQRDVAEILVQGLRRLEYRGYDSAGVAVVDSDKQLTRLRRLGKVQELADAVEAAQVAGGTGIAHTRWATHGEPLRSMLTPIFLVTLRWYTTALSKTMKCCVLCCKIVVMCLLHKRILKSLLI